MLPNPIDATPDSSSALANAIASSPEVTEEAQQAQGTQPGTAQQPESQEQTPQQQTENVPFNEHPRFKELIEERNWYRQQLERQSQSQPQPIQQQPTTDPYAGMTPEEERYWRMTDDRARRIAQQELQQIRPVIDAGRMELASMKVQQFRTSHPDILPNSPEEVAIAERINMGYAPEDAYRVVMYDKKVAQADGVRQTNVKKQMETKKQANTETRSMPVNNPLPVNQKIPLIDRIRQNYDKMERGEL